MIVYEVNLEIDDAIAEAYRAWLKAHVAEMLALPGFVSAEMFERRDPKPADGTQALTIHYEVIDRDALQRYFDEHAPRMRESGLRKFGNAFRATRRVLARV